MRWLREAKDSGRWTVLLVMLSAPILPAQAPDTRLLDSVLVANSMVLGLEDGRLTGPAAAFLLSEASRSQFVALGEEHNAAELPQFAAALFHALQRSAGFEYLADEQDPVTLQVISRPPLRGSLDSAAALARAFPHAFTFVSDQELALLADVATASRGKGNPLWGCDQSFGASLALDRLVPLAASPDARRLAIGLRDWAREKERIRDLERYHFMAVEPKSDSLAELARLVSTRPGSEAEFLVQSLVSSDRIYRSYREKRYYDNGYEREEYMKQRFLTEYRRAEARDGRVPRVLLKFGHWHVFRGQGPSNLQTLGNFVSEFAIANRSRSFHVAIFPYGDPGGYGDISAWTPHTAKILAAGASPSRWTAVDLRPLRAVYREVVATLPAEERDSFRRFVFGFDAALYIGRMHRATYRLNPGVKY